MNFTRRKFIASSISLTTVLGTTTTTFAKPEEVAAAIEELFGDAEITDGGITLKIPEIAENGNSVPLSVAVQSPMTADSYVESIAIFAESNPNPGVIVFNFTPASGEAFATTRIRLATTQNVVAMAKMNDGSVIREVRNVKVTIGGCGA